MPTHTHAVPAERYLTHNGVTIFHTYEDDDIAQGRCRFYFSTVSQDQSEASFDVRELAVPSQQRLAQHPPYLSASSNPEFATATPAQRAAWHAQWADWHRKGGGEEQAIRAILHEAIELGLIVTGEPEAATSPVFDNTLACQEGWDLFEVDGRLQLQRIDSPDSDDVGASEPLFDSDADALIHVALQAHTGSAYHRNALARIGQLSH